MGWSEPVSDDLAARRAGGRRRYNARRAILARFRQARVMELLCAAPPLAHGTQARIARELGVHRSTVSRDIRQVYKLWQRPLTRREQTREACVYALAQLERAETDVATPPPSPSADGQWTPPDGFDVSFQQAQEALNRQLADLQQQRPAGEVGEPGPAGDTRAQRED
jgi:hypothetical protein